MSHYLVPFGPTMSGASSRNAAEAVAFRAVRATVVAAVDAALEAMEAFEFDHERSGWKCDEAIELLESLFRGGLLARRPTETQGDS